MTADLLVQARGLEEVAPHLLGQKSGKVRRVCFAPLGHEMSIC